MKIKWSLDINTGAVEPRPHARAALPALQWWDQLRRGRTSYGTPKLVPHAPGPQSPTRTIITSALSWGCWSGGPISLGILVPRTKITVTVPVFAHHIQPYKAAHTRFNLVVRNRYLPLSCLVYGSKLLSCSPQKLSASCHSVYSRPLVARKIKGTEVL